MVSAALGQGQRGGMTEGGEEEKVALGRGVPFTAGREGGKAAAQASIKNPLQVRNLI